MAAVTAPEVARTRPGALQTIRRGLRLSPELRRGLPGTLVLALIATAGRVVVPIAIQQVIDGGIGGGSVDMAFVLRMCLYALGAVLITAGATGWMHLRLARVSETALSGLRIRAFRHIHDLSMLHQASEQRGALVSRVTSDVDEISRFMQWAGLMLITNTGQALLSLVVMLVYSPLLGAVVVASLPIILLTMKWFQSRLDRAYLTVREKVGRLLAVLAEVVVGAPVIRAYGIENRVRRRLAEAIEEHRQAGVDAGKLSSWFSGVGEMLSGLVLAAVVVAGTFMAVQGMTTVGTVVAFLFLVQLFIQPVQILGEAVNEAQTAVAGWRRVLDVLDIAPDVADPGTTGSACPTGHWG
jgi:ATP-binding cassette, subfamily B, bacterial